MIEIRPVSDLRNKFTEIERAVSKGDPIYLTKNGHGSMVVMSLEHYAKLTNDVEMRLDEADVMATTATKRLTHDQVFNRARNIVNG